ncbi:hypothetical protein MTO96_005893 [Rhipicephalus appendiculatus]
MPTATAHTCWWRFAFDVRCGNDDLGPREAVLDTVAAATADVASVTAVGVASSVRPAVLDRRRRAVRFGTTGRLAVQSPSSLSRPGHVGVHRSSRDEQVRVDDPFFCRFAGASTARFPKFRYGGT